MTEQQRRDIQTIRARWFERPMFVNPTIGTDFARENIDKLLKIIYEMEAAAALSSRAPATCALDDCMKPAERIAVVRGLWRLEPRHEIAFWLCAEHHYTLYGGALDVSPHPARVAPTTGAKRHE